MPISLIFMMMHVSVLDSGDKPHSQPDGSLTTIAALIRRFSGIRISTYCLAARGKCEKHKVPQICSYMLVLYMLQCS